MKRNNQWCIYTSSYDRGLEHLLKMWPDIKKEVSKAELHVFYGWQLFVQFYKDNPASMGWKANIDKLMKADGVIHHGRIAQPELEEWYKKCGIWAYPTHFGEISCISAMKAQAWGAIPVVTDWAALHTTVQHGIKVVGDIYDQETKDEYKKQLVFALKNDKWQEETRTRMMPWAQKTFGWDKVARGWDAEFKYDELKDAMNTIIKENKEAEKLMPVQLQQKHGLKPSY